MQTILRTGTESQSTRHEPGMRFHCCKCGQDKPVQTNGGTGYARDPEKDTLTCYECCADVDREYMREHGRVTLYISEKKEPTNSVFPRLDVANWPGTLRFHAFSHYTRKAWGFGGQHERLHAWFVGPDGFVWHAMGPGVGMFYRCKRTKQRA